MKRWGVPLLYVLAVLLALHAWRIKTGFDLQVYLRAGHRVLAGEEIYRTVEASAFKYAPPTAAVFAPLSLLPLRVAQLIWLLASALAFVRFVQLSSIARGLNAWWQSLVVLVLCSPYLSQVLFLGQADALLVLLMGLSELEAKRRPILSGVLWAVVVAFKLPFMLFVIPVVMFREWRRLVGLFVGALLVALVGVIAFGFDGLLHELFEWRALLQASTGVSLVATDNQSLTGILWKLGLQSQVLLISSSLVLLALGCWTRDRLQLSAMIFFFAAFLSPLGWLSNLVVIAPMAAALLASRHITSARVGLAALSVALLVNFDLLGRERFEAALQLRVFGWLTLCAALCLVVTHVRQQSRASPWAGG
ncbi:MAG: glycosyltransferase family 87 protein [Archangium sp.]